MKRIFLFVLICTGAVLLSGCLGNRQKKETATEKKEFKIPEIPAILTNPAERAEFLAKHYWDNYDFSDTSLIALEKVTEQSFVNYLDILPHVPLQSAEENLSKLMDKAMQGDSLMFAHFAAMAEKYLYDPNSPLRNEAFYIPVLRYIVASNNVEEVNKIRPQFQLEMALKNRPGEKAADFTYTLPNGKTGSLYGVRADYTVLFFNNPDCNDCKRVKEYIETVAAFNSSAGKKIAIVAIYPDEDLSLWKNSPYPKTWINGQNENLSKEHTYDLKAIPTLYLLDKDKNVILKDAPVEEIAEVLMQ